MEFVRAAASLTTNEGAEDRKRTSSRVAPLFPLRARHGHLRGFTLRGCQTFGSQSRETAEVGGAKGSRTPDLLNAIQALSQLSYGPNLGPARCWKPAPVFIEHDPIRKPVSSFGGHAVSLGRAGLS